MSYIIFTSDAVIGRVKTDAAATATANNAQYVQDTFSNYTLDQLEVVNGAVVAKSQSDIDAANTTEEWRKLRVTRDDLLSASDWTQSPDSPLTDAKKAEWRTYRQALRDITDTSDPTNVTWPSQPT